MSIAQSEIDPKGISSKREIVDTVKDSILESKPEMYETFGNKFYANTPAGRNKKLLPIPEKPIELMPNFYYDYVDFSDIFALVDKQKRIHIKQSVLNNLSNPLVI